MGSRLGCGWNWVGLVSVLPNPNDSPRCCASLSQCRDCVFVPHVVHARKIAQSRLIPPYPATCISYIIPKTALFALDYAALFDVYNKGLSALRLPLFLGGSFDYFRRVALCEIGYWDAFNVTEDADLGLRLACAGYESRAFASGTCEEAPTGFAPLVRQRARWLKVWVQTALTHLRYPGRFVTELGARNALAVTICSSAA